MHGQIQRVDGEVPLRITSRPRRGSWIDMKTTRLENMPPTLALSFDRRLALELKARRSVNKRYSIRAFAVLLGVDHATLSQILRGKRNVPLDRIAPWSRKLRLTSAEIAVYQALARVADEHVHLEERRVRQWGAEMLSLLTEPSHLKILQLVRSPDARRDSRWLAAAIGIGVDETNVALSRLLRLGLLEFSTGGWRDTTGLGELTARSFYKFVAAQVVIAPPQKKE
jgi:transcriptional regulator with XRE-family HTH domain